MTPLKCETTIEGTVFSQIKMLVFQYTVHFNYMYRLLYNYVYMCNINSLCIHYLHMYCMYNMHKVSMSAVIHDKLVLTLQNNVFTELSTHLHSALLLVLSF